MNQTPAPSQRADRERVERALRTAVDRLAASMRPEGWWEGRLSSSALSTATAVSALSLAAPRRPQCLHLADRGAAWLAATQNADGGWGDTPGSPSNLATTTLAVAALNLARKQAELAQILASARRYIAANTGGADLVEAVRAAYGVDRTFAVPILMNCALAGLVPWERIPRLPFELAALPHSWYKFLRLHVVSYALPALIAIGLLLDERKPSRNPLRKAARAATEGPAMRKLAAIQPASGGFLEAIPLTSFVSMSLIPIYGVEQPVAARCLGFLERAVRGDGSWPIDLNLSVWLTTNAVKALHAAGAIGKIDIAHTRSWIEARQYRESHPYTNASPGAWAWTHLPGGVPDTDDTSSAVLALAALGGSDAVPGGVRWLLRIQNADGGWPTYCKGWGRLPFDRSSPDLTAHAMCALSAAKAGDAASGAIERGMRYLRRVQCEDGSWVPLWFGNQLAPGKENPVIGTALVLRALHDMNRQDASAERGAAYLVAAQNSDGGWGGARGVASSIEETALAVSALAGCGQVADARAAAARGTDYLVRRIEDGSWPAAAPIGLYFASLWYFEELYSIIWSADALGRTLAGGIIAD